MLYTHGDRSSGRITSCRAAVQGSAVVGLIRNAFAFSHCSRATSTVNSEATVRVPAASSPTAHVYRSLAVATVLNRFRTGVRLPRLRTLMRASQRQNRPQCRCA